MRNLIKTRPSVKDNHLSAARPSLANAKVPKNHIQHIIGRHLPRDLAQTSHRLPQVGRCNCQIDDVSLVNPS